MSKRDLEYENRMYSDHLIINIEQSKADKVKNMKLVDSLAPY